MSGVPGDILYVLLGRLGESGREPLRVLSLWQSRQPELQPGRRGLRVGRQRMVLRSQLVSSFSRPCGGSLLLC